MNPWNDGTKRPRARRARAIVAALFSASLALAGAVAQAACTVEQMEIPVRIVDRRPIATLVLNGIPAPMLVDSGAFFSMLSASTAAQLQLPLLSLPNGLRIEGYTGGVEARRTRVAKVGLLKDELKNVDFIVGGNELGAGIMGVLGRNILAVADTEYDLAHGVVGLSFPKGDCDQVDLAYWAGEAPVVVVPLQAGSLRSDTAMRLDVSINGKRMPALMDTGAPQTSMTLKAARRAGIEERDLTPSGRARGTGTGQVASWIGPVALFELGGEKITDSRLRIDDVGNGNQDLVLGMDYFLSHRIYVARQQRRIYVTWNGGPVFPSGSTAPVKYDSRYAALPKDIDKDDADALARRGAAALAAGDHERALEDLNRACELAPEVAETFFARARLHMAMRQPSLALADLDVALRLDPALAEARMRRARLRMSLQDRPGAQADLAQLDASLPPSAALRADMAQMHANWGQASEALRQFDLWLTSHRQDARRASVLNERCWLRARLNLEPELALKDCEQAVDIDDGDASFQDSLGWAYLRLGDAKKAKRAFDAAVKLKPLPFSLYGRGLAFLRLNDSGNGQRDLAAARNLLPSIDEAVRQQGFEFADAKQPPPAPPT